MSSYTSTVFLNIPVLDLQRSIKFYTAIGFVQNVTFSSPEAAMMSLPPTPSATGPAAHEGPFKIMLLTHPFYDNFMPDGTDRMDPRKAAQCLICVGKESREAVDETAEKAVENGGEKDIREKTEPERQMEKAGMYGRVLRDPDGHIIETIFMPKESYEGKE
jgi:uncharacterized protein